MTPAKRQRAPGELTPKGEQTRQRIVAAAAQLMVDGSVSETTIEDVRVAAGVSSSQVYHYFKDKKALVQAVIEYHDETIVVMFTIAPLPRSAIRGASSPTSTNGDCTFVAKTLSNAPAVSTVEPNGKMPALFTSMSTRP